MLENLEDRITGLTGNQRQWLGTLIQSEIEELYGTIANDAVWIEGSEGEERLMNKNNFEEHSDYLLFLQALKGVIE